MSDRTRSAGEDQTRLACMAEVCQTCKRFSGMNVALFVVVVSTGIKTVYPCSPGFAVARSQLRVRGDITQGLPFPAVMREDKRFCAELQTQGKILAPGLFLNSAMPQNQDFSHKIRCCVINGLQHAAQKTKCIILHYPIAAHCWGLWGDWCLSKKCFLLAHKRPQQTWGRKKRARAPFCGLQPE